MIAPNEFTRENLPSPLRAQQAEWGMVLGSGLGSFVEELQVKATVAYSDIENFPVSKVAGHAGRFLFGSLGECRVLIAQGRVHLYEGHQATNVCATVRLMAALGVKKLILTNAAGTANPEFAPGDWMMLIDHLNLTGTTPLLGGANFFDMTEVYSKRLRTQFVKAAAEEKITLHEGVYAGLLGPQYETPAEVRMLRRFGADAIGMSTVLEAIQARALGIEVVGFSCLTNWGAGLGKEPLSHREVLEAGENAAAEFARVAIRALHACPD